MKRDCQEALTRNVGGGCDGSAGVAGREEVRDGVPDGVGCVARGAGECAGHDVVAIRVLNRERERRLVGWAGEDVDQVAVHRVCSSGE